MKFRSLVLMAVMAVGLLMVGCTAGGAAGAASQLTQANQALAEVRAEVRAAAVAATQPIVVVPATDTQPAVVVDPPAEVTKPVGKFIKAVDKAVPYVTAASTVVTAAAQPDANLGATITQAAPLFGPYAGYVALGGLAVTALTGIWGAIQAKKAQKAGAALTSTVAGVRDALNSGDLTANPTAAAVIDAAVVAHPATDELVDAVHAAAMPVPAT